MCNLLPTTCTYFQYFKRNILICFSYQIRGTQYLFYILLVAIIVAGFNSSLPSTPYSEFFVLFQCITSTELDLQPDTVYSFNVRCHSQFVMFDFTEPIKQMLSSLPITTLLLLSNLLLLLQPQLLLLPLLLIQSWLLVPLLLILPFYCCCFPCSPTPDATTETCFQIMQSPNSNYHLVPLSHNQSSVA